MPPSISEFLNTPAEKHSFLNGLAEVICPIPPLRKAMSQARANEILDEYHYYLLGRIIGVLFWLLIALLSWEIFS